MHSSDKFFIIILSILCLCFAYATEVKATPELEEAYPWIEVQQTTTGIPEIPWPKGEKVPCRCDILSMPYELCLKGIGAEECFKVKEVKEQEPKKLERDIPLQPEMPEYTGQPIMYPEVLPCHPIDIWLERMQTEYQMYPFAQGKGVLRNGQTLEFARPDMVMLVNPLTNKYMMLGLWPNGWACVLASGSEFQRLVK